MANVMDAGVSWNPRDEDEERRRRAEEYAQHLVEQGQKRDEYLKDQGYNMKPGEATTYTPPKAEEEEKPVDLYGGGTRFGADNGLEKLWQLPEEEAEPESQPEPVSYTPPATAAEATEEAAEEAGSAQSTASQKKMEEPVVFVGGEDRSRNGSSAAATAAQTKDALTEEEDALWRSSYEAYLAARDAGKVPEAPRPRRQPAEAQQAEEGLSYNGAEQREISGTRGTTMTPEYQAMLASQEAARQAANQQPRLSRAELLAGGTRFGNPMLDSGAMPGSATENGASSRRGSTMPQLPGAEWARGITNQLRGGLRFNGGSSGAEQREISGTRDTYRPPARKADDELSYSGTPNGPSNRGGGGATEASDGNSDKSRRAPRNLGDGKTGAEAELDKWNEQDQAGGTSGGTTSGGSGSGDGKAPKGSTYFTPSYGQDMEKGVKAPYRKGGYTAEELEAMGNKARSDQKYYNGKLAYEGYYLAPDGHYYPVDMEKAAYYRQNGNSYEGWNEDMRKYYQTFGTYYGYRPDWQSAGRSSNSYSYTGGSYSGGSYYGGGSGSRYGGGSTANNGLYWNPNTSWSI